jgi:hypothetical protein
MKSEKLAELLYEKVKQEGGVHRWAAENGIDYSFVSRVMNLKKPMSPKVAEALGYRLVDDFEKIK